VALWILPRGKTETPGEASRERHQLFAGIRHILRTPHLRGALLTVLLTSCLCGPLIVFCPVLVKQELHGSVGDFSAAMGAVGGGGLLGGLLLLGIDPARDRRKLSTGFAVVYGLVLVSTALNPWLWALPVLLALSGLSMNLTNTSANALLQATTFPGLRGQTVSLYMLALRGGLSVGSLVTGLSIGLFGVREALFINGALAIAAQLIVGREWLQSTRENR
jgi:predicted MFS family arabinose efflux permease